MVKNYLKVALRNITKHKFFSIINILGLTIGVAGSLFVVMYIFDELSYDKFHPKAERIYRMNLHGKLSGQEIYTTNTCLPMSKAMVAEIPEVEEAVRVNAMGDWIIRYGDKLFEEEDVLAVDSNFFQVFGFKLLEGNAETALTNPKSIVINQDLAKKYFGTESPLDKAVSIGNSKEEYLVTGVVENVPGNSHLKFKVLLSSSSFPWMSQGNWLSNNLWTYYVIREGASSNTVDEKLEPIMETNATTIFQDFLGKSLEEFRDEGGIYSYYSIPMLDIHLFSDHNDEQEPPGDISYIYILAAIGLFILLIACINFMNLTTAKSAGRAKEVGLRKTLGSLRSTLIGQFLTESIIYAVSATLLALVIVYALLPAFNELSGKQLSMDILSNPLIVGIMVSIVVFVGLMAGSYPAFYLTSFKITEVLKGKVRSGMKSGSIRGVLVTFQFWISIVLIICTTIIYQQLKHVQNTNLGIDKDHIMILQGANRLEKNKANFKNKLEQLTSIKSTSYANNEMPGVNNTTIFRAAGIDTDYLMSTYYTDHDHLNTLGLEMVEGRFFSKDFPADSSKLIINEAAMKELGWDSIEGKRIVSFDEDEPREMEVIGVLKDFNYESLKVNIRPLVLQLSENRRTLYVRFSNIEPDQLVKTISEIWSTYDTGDPLDYSFLNEDYDALFRSEQRLGRVFTVFTGIAIFIACLGLFGLAAFMAEQRTKEIGIRKVMGASLWSITSSMSVEFTKLVLIAFVLAVYPAYYVMDQWLADFASRVEMSVWIFVIGGLTSILIAWLTVSYQSLKAARVNPVNSLRYE